MEENDCDPEWEDELQKGRREGRVANICTRPPRGRRNGNIRHQLQKVSRPLPAGIYARIRKPVQMVTACRGASPPCAQRNYIHGVDWMSVQDMAMCKYVVQVLLQLCSL